MKRAINHLLALAPALLLMASCEAETDRVGGGRQERVLLVSSENVDTRTTIDYELSDYSHLTHHGNICSRTHRISVIVTTHGAELQ